MSSEVQTFLDMLNSFHDLQRRSRFKAFFYNLPSCCNTQDGFSSNYNEILSLRCEAIDLPGRQLSTFNHRTYGPIIQYPMQTAFPDIQLTFLLSANKKGLSNTGMGEKRIFENWINYINPYPGEKPNLDYVYHNFRYKDEYNTKIDVVCYDNDDVPSYMMSFVGAYPVQTGAVSLSWADESVARLPVVFTYEYSTFTDQCECAPGSPGQTSAPPITTQIPRQIGGSDNGKIVGPTPDPIPQIRSIPNRIRNSIPQQIPQTVLESVKSPATLPQQIPQTVSESVKSPATLPQQIPQPQTPGSLPAPSTRAPLALPQPQTPGSLPAPSTRAPLALPPPQQNGLTSFGTKPLEIGVRALRALLFRR